jgi:deoxyribonuclease-4
MLKKIIDHKIGSHLSIKNGLLKIFDQAEDLGIKTFACFTNSSLSYGIDKDLDQEITQKFKKKIENENYKVFSHANYLINISNKQNIDSYEKSILSVVSELKRCDKLGILGTVFHPGSNSDKKIGLDTIVESIDKILEIFFPEKSYLILESSAGQGFTLPVFLDELKYIFENISEKSKSKCRLALDTCHLHSAGYDLSFESSVNNFLAEFEKKIGFEKLIVIHLNNSKFKSSSKKDRHENLSKGSISKEGFITFLNQKNIKTIPKILETPVKSHMDWLEDLNFLENYLLF